MRGIHFRINGELRVVFGQLGSGVRDRNRIQIFEGDTLRFTDKWEWYRASLGFVNDQIRQEILTDHKKYPYEDRVIKLPEDYAWLLSSEIQSYWEIVDNESELHLHRH